MMRRERLAYLLVFLALTGVEVVIGVFFHDDFVRPYVGDALIVVVLWALVRCVAPRGLRWLPGAIFAFACAVEALQAIHLVDRLGITSPLLRTLMGTSFAWGDILAYAVGCGLLWGLELLIRRRNET